MSVTLVRTVSLSIYQQSKYFFDEQIYRATGTSPLVIANTRGAYPNLYTIACFGASGMVAGATITAIACPFELVKVAQQLAELMSRSPNKNMDVKMALSYKGKGTFGTAKQIIINRGTKLGIYSGFSYHLFRDTVGTGVYFMTYESVKQLLANSRGDSPTSPAAVVVAGAACGIASWCCVSYIYLRFTLIFTISNLIHIDIPHRYRKADVPDELPISEGAQD
jgi:solute carrier family 25 (mitochondrial carnitine/acylcarnitine transporter), member 20/29